MPPPLQHHDERLDKRTNRTTVNNTTTLLLYLVRLEHILDVQRLQDGGRARLLAGGAVVHHSHPVVQDFRHLHGSVDDTRTPNRRMSTSRL